MKEKFPRPPRRKLHVISPLSILYSQRLSKKTYLYTVDVKDILKEKLPRPPRRKLHIISPLSILYPQRLLDENIFVHN